MYRIFMNRIDVHCHFIPNLDDGCQSLAESLACLRMMAAAGYSRIFCTPHCGASEFSELTPSEISERVRMLQGHADAAGIPLQLKPGGEVRLSPDLATDLPEGMVPTFDNAGKYVLADTWETDWPDWAAQAVQWLQRQGPMVIIAHPERMQALRDQPERIDELAALGVLFQGNLGPLGGGDAADVVALSRRYLLEGRYFMVGTDGHRLSHLPVRMAGLRVIEDLLGPEKLEELTVTHPARLWEGPG
jgi:protein-tyrosine phosphatase